MKNSVKKIISLSIIGICCLSANAFKGYYQGIGKMAGKPSDLWVILELDGEDGDYNIGDAYKFLGAYTTTGSGNNLTVSIKVPGMPNSVLKTTDGGESFEGKVSLPMNQNLDLWLLKVPKKLKPAEESKEELTRVIGLPDGYNSFLLMRQNTGIYCVTGEVSFSNGRFSIYADTPSLQDLLRNMKGEYEVEGNSLKLKTVSGHQLKGEIFNNGNYIKIDLGSGAGMKLSMILIR